MLEIVIKRVPLLISLILFVTFTEGALATVTKVPRELLSSSLLTLRSPVISCKSNSCNYAESNLIKDHPDMGQIEIADQKYLQISIVTPRQASEIFAEMQAQPQIPFRYPEDGCYARADEMAWLLEAKGLIVAKVFAQGFLRYQTKHNSQLTINMFWRNYHVAPILLVETSPKNLQITVIDPSMFDRPVSSARWLLEMTQYPETKLTSMDYANRFNWEPPLNNRLSEYTEERIQVSKTYMAKFLEKQRLRELNLPQ